MLALSNLPPRWREMALGDLSEPPQYGASAPARPFDSRLPRYVRITDITDDGCLRPTDLRSADPSQVKGYELRAGDLLFARTGSVGRTYLYREKDGPCVYAGYLIRFRPKPSVALPRFIEIFTRSAYYRRWVASMLRVGAQPNINAAEYSSLRIPLPPLSEQRAIVVALDGVDEAINRTGAEINATERLRDSLRHRFLTGGVPGRRVNSRQVPILGTVPEDWHIARVSDVFDILDRRRKPLNAEERAKIPGDFPYYGANGLVDYIGDWIFDEPDDLVLLAEDGGHFDDFRTRPIAYRVRGKCWVNNHAHILRAKDPNASSFLFHSMANKDIRPFINGTTRSKLTQADLRRIKIGIPSTNAEMSFIGNCLDAIGDLLIQLRSHRRSMEDTRLALSTGLLDGLIDVSRWKESSRAYA